MSLLPLLLGSPAGALDAGTKCEATKLTVAGKYALCRLKADAKAVKSGVAPDFARCGDTFDRKWQAVESKSGGLCPTFGDAATVLALLADCTTAVPGGTASTTTTSTSTSTTSTTPACAATSGCFCDLGDGTLLDTCTGLQWEKKDGADGMPGLGTPDYANPHDVDNAYTWSDLADGDGTDPDGSMFTEFLAALNGSTSSDGVTVTGCFAGHCDWRLPQIDELATIVDLGAPGCGSGNPCIDGIFGPTASNAGNYSSGTTVDATPAFPWVIRFVNGVPNAGVIKYDDDFVRAVR